MVVEFHTQNLCDDLGLHYAIFSLVFASQWQTECLVFCNYCVQNERYLKHVEHLLLPTDAHNVKNVELLKHSKIDKNAPTCFGLHGNHLQGAKVSTWLKVTRLVNSRCVEDVQDIVSAMAAYCDCNKGYVWNM